MPETTRTSTSTTTNRRWGTGERVDNPAQGAARILAAARHCFAESSVAATTIDQVASGAGVSRRTVYRYFDNKDAIVQALVEEQAEPFFAEIGEFIRTSSDLGIGEILIHCVLFAVERGPLMEGHQLLLGRKNANETAFFYLRSARMQGQLRDLLEDRFRQSQQSGEVDPDWKLDDLLNWMGRLVYSFIQNPEPPENLERMLRQFLFPSLADKLIQNP